MSNSSDGSFDMVKPRDKSEKKKDKYRDRSRRSSKRSSMGDSKSQLDNSTSVFAYGSKYVKPAEEKISLVSSENVDPNDPLIITGTGDQFQDEYQSQDGISDDMEMDKCQNFNKFGETEKKSKTKSTCKTYFIPFLIGFLFLLGAVAIILYIVADVIASKSSTQTVQLVAVPPENLSLMCHDSNPQGPSLTTEVPALCKDSCMKAECCWNPTGKFVCSEDSRKQCPTYQVECAVWKTHLVGASNNNDNTNNNNIDEMEVPAFTPGLPTSCAPTLSEISQDCQSGCQAAACCWNKLSTTVCTANSVHNCLNYNDVCLFLNDHLDETGKVVIASTNDQVAKDWPWPDAPNGLGVYCDPSEMEEISLHICQDKCSKAECCWKTGVPSCVDTYAPQACHDYTQACGILNQISLAPGNSHDITAATSPPATAQSNTNTLEAAPADLAELCNQDKFNDSENGGDLLIQCETKCLKASCCWQPNAASPCLDNAYCGGYGVCDIFVDLFAKPIGYDSTAKTLPPVTVTEVPEAPGSLSLNCAPDVLKTSVAGGKFIVECEKECLMGACCWKQNHPTQCPDAQECSAYLAPCGTNLVDALLALEGGVAGPSGTTPPATEAPTQAPTPPPTSAVVVESNVPEAPNDLAMMCSPDVLKLTVSDGDFIIQCEKECLEAACCWKKGHATVCPDAPQCDEYLVPCGEHLAPVLEQMESSTGNGDSGTATTPAPAPTPASTPASTPAPGPSIPRAPDDMALRCSLENLNTNPSGRGLCEESCAQAECCWKNGVQSCGSNTLCEEYQECKNLETTSSTSGSTGDNTPPSPPTDLVTICAAQSILDLNGLQKCRVACEAASCCWTDASDPTTCTTAVECRTYETGCELMRNMLTETLSNSGGGNANTSPVDSIQSACDNTTAFYLRSHCEEECRPGQCCLTSTTACQAGIDCLNYEPCLVLKTKENRGVRRMLRHLG